MTKETDIIIIGAGPVGLFTVFEAGLLGLECILIDNLDKIGGQCSELYPEKPIYDIPGVPNQTAQEHVDALLKQIEPFKYDVFLNERVESLEEIKDEDISSWKITTSEGNELKAKSIFIAAGAGSFEPRRPPNIENPDRFLEKGVSYSVKSKEKFKNKERMLKSFLIPICFWIKNKSNHKKPFLIGLAGGQGTGKTTTSYILKIILEKYFKLNVFKISIDDFYKTRKERILLSKKIHPMLLTRGVPGTHDINMMLNFFKKAKSKNFKKIDLPNFNKAVDDRFPKKNWYKIKDKPDVIIFEGW